MLYNYLFARHHGGKFILRIEDTDQGRFVRGAEQYIHDCLTWCGLEPDESPVKGGSYGPYRQSERKATYRQHAEKLVKDGHAYYAFDTPAELEAMRTNYKTASNPSPQYNQQLRNKMINSLTLEPARTEELLKNNTPHVIRIKMPENEEISFTDMIRGKVTFNSSIVDDKVLLKADGMPTYHLAVVADDRAMEITHAFRGEEWLSSAPVHVLLWKHLFGLENMPQWAHFPLILGPNGKLSKRDGAKYGFPVFAMNWLDPKTNELTEGFREKGFLPDAFVNMLAMLGWNDGSGKELFTKEELVEKFSIERVHSSGARFDYEKAKWFNHEWIKKDGDRIITAELKKILEEKNLDHLPDMPARVASIIKDRCTLLTDIWPNSFFFFESPKDIDTASIKAKWTNDKVAFFNEAVQLFSHAADWNAQSLETQFKELAATKNMKPGELLLPLRIMLVGQKTGPGVFEIIETIGKIETNNRITHVINHPSLTS